MMTKEQYAEYYAKNRERICQSKREYHAANKERVSQRKKDKYHGIVRKHVGLRQNYLGQKRLDYHRAKCRAELERLGKTNPGDEVVDFFYKDIVALKDKCGSFTVSFRD